MDAMNHPQVVDWLWLIIGFTWFYMVLYGFIWVYMVLPHYLIVAHNSEVEHLFSPKNELHTTQCAEWTRSNEE